MNDGSVRFYMKGNGTAAFIYGNIVTDNNWHHIAASRNGSTGEMKIFVDGVLNNSKIQLFSTDFSSPTVPLIIGGLNGYSHYRLTGSLDEIAIFNSELTPTR